MTPWKCSLGDPFQKLFAKFDLSINMALVNGGYVHCTDVYRICHELIVEIEFVKRVLKSEPLTSLLTYFRMSQQMSDSFYHITESVKLN